MPDAAIFSSYFISKLILNKRTKLQRIVKKYVLSKRKSDIRVRIVWIKPVIIVFIIVLFEDAGITNEDLVAINSKVGVYVGVSNAHYAGLSIAALLRGHPNGGNSSAWSIPNRISYFWDLKGPSMAVDTACSSSLTAIHLACEGIRSGSCHMAIAGGVSLILSPTHFNCLSQVKTVSYTHLTLPTIYSV